MDDILSQMFGGGMRGGQSQQPKKMKPV